MTMRGAIGGILAGTLLLSACTLPSNGTLSDLKRDEVRARATPKASPTPTPELSATPTPAPEATATPTPAVSATPSVPMRLLSGLVKIDANYIITTGGGNIISTGGGNIISTGGGNIIAAGGGNIISTGGGNIISTGGGNIISTGGGNIIAAGGGNIISTGGGNFRTLLETTAIPPIGTMLPVKGMAVVPISLLTGQAIGPMAFSDEEGEYQVSVPESVEDNILLFAAVPAKDEESARNIDHRLRYGLVVDPRSPESAVVDEDSALLTKYMLSIFVGRLREILMVPSAEFDTYLGEVFAGRTLDEVPEIFRTAIINSIKELRVEADKRNFTDEQKTLLAYRLSDALASRIDFEAITVNPTHYDLGGSDYPGWRTHQEQLGSNILASEMMTEVLSFLRTQVVKKMNDGHPFAQEAYMIEANKLQADRKLPLYTIERPSDFGDFFIREYLATNGERVPNLSDHVAMKATLTDIEAIAMPETGYYVQGLLRAVQVSILVELISKLTGESKAQMIELIETYE